MYFAINTMTIFGLHSSKKMHESLINRLMKTTLGFFDVTPIGRLLNHFSRDLRVCPKLGNLGKTY